METINRIVNDLHPYWPLILLASGPIASLISQRLKKWLSLQRDWVISTLVLLVSAGVAMAQYIMTGGDLPLWSIGPSTAYIMTGATLYFNFVNKSFKPWFNELRELRNVKSQIQNPNYPQSPLTDGTAIIPVATGSEFNG